MRPSLTALSKASRLPLNSKMGNKNFYKGAGATNIMRRKRIATHNRYTGEQLYDHTGRPKAWAMKTHRIDEMRVDSYIVPPGLGESKLKPLVFNGSDKDGAVSDDDKVTGFPGSSTKMQHGIGFDGRYYERLRLEILDRRGGRS